MYYIKFENISFEHFRSRTSLLRIKVCDMQTSGNKFAGKIVTFYLSSTCKTLAKFWALRHKENLVLWF